jgi:methionyl-tRNA synthetase
MRWTVTSALPYVNNIPHLGNMAGSVLPADIFARFLRAMEEDVIFICGTDEHGTPITVAAMKEGLTPKELADKYYKILRDLYEKMDMKFDNFGRTTYPDHYPLTQKFFMKLLEKGFITKKTMKMPYCGECKMFLPDRYVEGVCPKCGFSPARGDQCEKCGSLLNPAELKEPYCVTCKTTPKIKSTEHWFLDLPKFAPGLKKWINGSKEWPTDTKNMALGFIKTGLQQRCITRDIEWGVPVPLPEAKDKVLYVWFDAPIGYVSNTVEWAKKIGKPDEWKRYWMNKDTRIVHFLGKDNVIFHTIIWPAMLMGQDKYQLPYQVIGLQWLNWEGGKFSKSRQRGIFLDDAVELFPADYWRYILVALAPQTKDSDFTWKEFIRRVNTELNGAFGNFVHRTLTYVNSKFNGKIPNGKEDPQVSNRIRETMDAVRDLMFKHDQKGALTKAMELASFGNQYMNDKEPWKNPGIEKDVIYNCCIITANLSVVFLPFLPSTSKNIQKMMGFKQETWHFVANITGNLLSDVKPLFERVEKDEIKKKLKTIHEKEDKVDYKQFSKVKMRIATVISAERVKGSDKLIKMQVDLDKEKRQIVAGIGKVYKPKELLGKQITIVTNLESRKVMGELSDGMILAAGEEDNLALLIPDKRIESGSEVA